MQRWLASGLLAILSITLVAISQVSTAPEIIYLSFPKEIKADGTPVSGVIAFKDIDGDIIRAEFAVVQATDFQPFSFDPKVKGIKKGEFPFQLATKTAQRVTLQATLLDEAGHKSAPWEFSFTAVATAVLQVSPTSLNFSTEVGRNPASQTIQITNAGTGTLSWSANADQPWITLSPTKGTAPSTMTVSINVTGLGAGSYQGRVTIIAPEASGNWAAVNVILELRSLSPRTFTGHTASVTQVRFSPDGMFLASSSADRTIKLWEVNTGQEVRSIRGFTYSVFSVTYSPDGRLLGSGNRDGIKLWEVRTGNLVRAFRGSLDWANSVEFSPDGTLLAAGGGSSQDTSVLIELWEVATGRKTHTLRGQTDSPLSVAFSPDGAFLASGSCGPLIGEDCSGGWVQIWDVKTGAVVQTFTNHSDAVKSVAFSPDAQLVAAGSFDKTIKLWQVKTGKLIQTLTGHAGIVKSVAFSPNGQFLASGSADRTIKLWEVSTGREVRTFQAHTDQVNSVAFSPDGKLLASGSADNTIKLWDVSDLTGQ